MFGHCTACPHSIECSAATSTVFKQLCARLARLHHTNAHCAQIFSQYRQCQCGFFSSGVEETLLELVQCTSDRFYKHVERITVSRMGSSTITITSTRAESRPRPSGATARAGSGSRTIPILYDSLGHGPGRMKVVRHG